MVDQPEGRPKSPGPGKVKPVTKKHSVSKPYERPSSSRGVLARVKELITPVTPGWLKDLVLRPPQSTSITDALEQTVAEVQAADEKGPEEFKKTLKTLSLPITEVRREPKLPFTTERTNTPSVLNVSEVNTPPSTHSKTNVLEETLGDIRWSTIRPAVKEKYSFSVAAFNTPSKSPNLSAISVHNRSLSRANAGNASPFTNRSRVSFGGNSLQRSLLHNRSASNASGNDDKKPIKVKPISRTTVRPGVTSNTAKKILEQLESLSRPLGHLPSSRPSTPSSRPCSRASTPLSLSRPSTPQHPYKTERAIPIRSLTSTPHERAERGDINTSTATSVGGKMKRERTNYKDYTRTRVEEDNEVIVPNYETISVEMDFKPIELDKHTEHKPIKIVNQTSFQQKDHVPLKDAIRNTLTSNISPLVKKKSLSPPSGNESTDSGFSFTAPITVTNSALSTTSLSDSAEFSFGAPGSAAGMRSGAQSVEDILRSVREKEEEKVEIAAQQPPGSWSCVPCKLSNPCAMTRCSGCEAPNPSLHLPGLFKLHSPIGIKRAPITPMKPAVSPKHMKVDPVLFGLGEIKEEQEQKEETKHSPLVKFSLPPLSGWECGTCLLRNKEDAVTCIACQAAKPTAKPAVASAPKPSLTSKLAGMDNPLLKFKKVDHWSCNTCMLSNPADLDKCQACQAVKPAVKTGGSNPLLAFVRPDAWDCGTCMLKNDTSADKCKACETPKPGAKPAEIAAPTGVFQSLGKFKQSGWSCSTCLLINPETDMKCKACETLKPGAKPEDVKVETKKEDKPATTNTFTFGVGTVGGPSDDTAGFGDFKLSSTFDFGSKTSKTDGGESIGFTFGVKPKVEEKSDKPAFGLTASSEKPAFSFGVKSDPESKPSESKPSFSFGPASSTGDNKPAFNFGGSSTTESKPAFGSLTSDSAPKFNFGGGSSSEKKPETSTAPTFNFAGSTTEKKDPPAFNFGGTSTEKKDPPAFSFAGGVKATPTTETKPAVDSKTGFTFGSGAPSTGSGFNFGSTASTTAATFNFGANKPATSAPAPAFTAAPKSESTNFQFGGPAAHNTDSGDTMDASSQSPKGFSFGQKPATTNGPSFSFGAGNNGSTNAGFNFGSGTSTVTAPAFGASTTPAPAFGSSSTPSFGSNTSNTNTSTPAFSFGQNSSSFGQSSNTSAGFNFGGAPKPATTGFNFSAAAPQAAPSTGFNFGGTTTSTPTPSFNFGGGGAGTTFGNSTNTPAPTPAASFGASSTPAPSFGNTPSIPAPSFNFGAAGSTPSNSAFQFGSPQSTPTQNSNMFNPVSSSTSGRRIRKAVRRTKR